MCVVYTGWNGAGWAKKMPIICSEINKNDAQQVTINPQ